MAVVIKSNNVTNFDIINARTSIAFKDVAGEAIQVKAAAVITDDETNKEYTYLWDDDGTCYAGNSASIRDVAEPIIELINEGEKLAATVITRTSKNGKDFLSLKVSSR